VFCVGFCVLSRSLLGPFHNFVSTTGGIFEFLKTVNQYFYYSIVRIYTTYLFIQPLDLFFLATEGNKVVSESCNIWTVTNSFVKVVGVATSVDSTPKTQLSTCKHVLVAGACITAIRNVRGAIGKVTNFFVEERPKISPLYQAH
jgi:hypothetical protein